MNIEHTTLQNGLNTLFIHSPNSNVTTAQIWFRAGSSLESGKNKGIAHFLEHMFFKGSKKYPNMQIAKTIEAFGGEINAFTSFDYTCYYINGPRPETNTITDVLLDMVSNPLFLEEDLLPEREVVFEEFRRSIDNPSQYNFFKIQNSSFPKGYAHPILGTETNIKNFSLEQLSDFRQKYYNLENSLLVIAGNLDDKESLLKTIEGYKLPNGDKSSFPKFKLNQTPQTNIHQKSVNQATITMTIQAPTYTSTESPAEDLALNCLCYGDISPLYKDLVSKDSLANGVSGSTMFFSNGGVHFLKISSPVENLDKVLKQFPKTLENVLKTGFTQDGIDRIRNQYIASKVYEKETLESFAFSLGHGFAQAENIDCEDEFIKNMKMISKSKVKTSLLDIFARNIHATVQLPNDYQDEKLEEKVLQLKQSIKKKVDNEIKKTATKTKLASSEFDDTTKLIKLNNRISLLYRQNQMTPTFALHAYIKGGLTDETKENNGIYNLISKNLTYGHKEIKYEDLKNELEIKSSYINGFSGRNAYGLILHGLSEYSHRLIEHFMKMILSPTMPNNYFKLEKELIKRTMHLQKEDPVKHCFKNFNKLVFNGHPYQQEMLGNEKSLKKIKRKDVLEKHLENIQHNEMVITYCGDLDLESVLEILSPYTKELKKISGAKKKFNQKKYKPKFNHNIHLDFDREQTHIMIGKSSFKVGTDEDLYLKMFTTFLAGQSSELFLEVRDRKGLCYSVQPLQNTSVEGGYWGIYIGAGHDKAKLAIDAIMEIINKYRDHGFSQEDFDQIKKMIQGQNLLNIQTNEDYANFYSIPVLHKMGIDYQHHAFQKMQDMKLVDFNKFLKEFLNGDWNTISVGR